MPAHLAQSTASWAECPTWLPSAGLGNWGDCPPCVCPIGPLGANRHLTGRAEALAGSPQLPASLPTTQPGRESRWRKRAGQGVQAPPGPGLGPGGCQQDRGSSESWVSLVGRPLMCTLQSPAVRAGSADWLGAHSPSPAPMPAPALPRELASLLRKVHRGPGAENAVRFNRCTDKE